MENEKFFGHRESIVLHNYLRDSLSLEGLLNQEMINNLMARLLDKYFTLTNMVARNRTTRYKKLVENNQHNEVQIGYGWHVDARKGSKGKPEAMSSYIVMIFLEDVGGNAANTIYIPKSHLRGKMNIDDVKKSAFCSIKAAKGSVAIMDSNIVHSGTDATNVSRWTIFNLYSHWHVKPYFNYPEIFKEQRMLLKKETLKQLHFNSMPPINENLRVNTLIKEQT